MLKIEPWAVFVREKSLSKKTVRSLIRIFSDRIPVLRANCDNKNRQNSHWLYWQDPFSPQIQKQINTYLWRIWLILSDVHRERNSLVAYKYVDTHSDARSFVELDRSIVFIPLSWHTGAEFVLNPDSQKETRKPIDNWSVVIFDQNQEHQVDFSALPDTTKLKFWLSFFVDRL
jgi:hypothetical protein